MSHILKPGFKSKLPRPVSRFRSVDDLAKHNRSHSKSFQTQSGSVRPAIKPKSTNGPSQQIQLSQPKSLACSDFEVKKEVLGEEDEFQADPKALESILSNKGITMELLSGRPSSAQQLQTVKRSSIYYQPPSRMSMMESHTQFKEKKKILNEQIKIKSLNIKFGGNGTPKSAHEKTPSTAPSVRPVSLYYHSKPLQKKPLTPTQTTPVVSRLQHLSMSERKQLEPKDLNSNRLYHTASKLNSKQSRFDKHSAGGKENRVRFNLFPSPIHEEVENTSPHNNEISSSESTSRTLLKSLSENGDEMKLSKELHATKGIATENKTNLSLVSSKSKDIVLLSDLMPSTPLSLSSHCNDVSYIFHKTHTSPAVMSASTSSTWSIKNSICTPKSSIITPAKILPKTCETVTPVKQITGNNHEKDCSIMKSHVSTPSRTVSINDSLRKAPQRIMINKCQRDDKL